MCGIKVNSVSDAKQTEDKNFCTLDDIEYREDVTNMYTIDADGNPVDFTNSTDGDFQCYHCNNCDIEFSNFIEVKEHICQKE